MQDVKLYTQNAPQYEGDCEYRISSICMILIISNGVPKLAENQKLARINWTTHLSIVARYLRCFSPTIASGPCLRVAVRACAVHIINMVSRQTETYHLSRFHQLFFLPPL